MFAKYNFIKIAISRTHNEMFKNIYKFHIIEGKKYIKKTDNSK